MRGMWEILTDVLDLLGDEFGETLLKALGLGGGSVTPGGDRGLRDVQTST